MYRVIKVLNNNGILVYHVETGKEMILLGNGVGFGKKPTEQIEKLPGSQGIFPCHKKKAGVCSENSQWNPPGVY